MSRPDVLCPRCDRALPFERWIPGPWAPNTQRGGLFLIDRYSCDGCLSLIRVHETVQASPQLEIAPHVRAAVVEIEGRDVSRAIERLRRASADGALLAEIELLREDPLTRLLLRVPEVFVEARSAIPRDVRLLEDCVYEPATRMLTRSREAEEWHPRAPEPPMERVWVSPRPPTAEELAQAPPPELATLPAGARVIPAAEIQALFAANREALARERDDDQYEAGELFTRVQIRHGWFRLQPVTPHARSRYRTVGAPLDLIAATDVA